MTTTDANDAATAVCPIDAVAPASALPAPHDRLSEIIDQIRCIVDEIGLDETLAILAQLEAIS
jgi:hypothetical protein